MLPTESLRTMSGTKLTSPDFAHLDIASSPTSFPDKKVAEAVVSQLVTVKEAHGKVKGDGLMIMFEDDDNEKGKGNEKETEKRRRWRRRMRRRMRRRISRRMRRRISRRMKRRRTIMLLLLLQHRGLFRLCLLCLERSLRRKEMTRIWTNRHKNQTLAS